MSKTLSVELCTHETRSVLGLKDWSDGEASSRTTKDNSNATLLMQITRDGIISIFIIAD